MTRTDIHRPSVITPTDYQFVSFHSHREEDAAAQLFENARFRDHMAAHKGAKFSTHSHGGSCHVCGAHASTVARFYHAETNTYVETGETCMGKMDCGEASAFRAFRASMNDARANAAGKAKAQMVLADAGLGLAWDIRTSDDRENFGYEESVVCDIVNKLVKYGDVSEKQTEYLRNLLKKIVARPEIEAARQAEKDAAAPIPSTGKRITVTGEILSMKGRDTYYGYVTKLLVQSVDGWKVYGTLPSALSDAIVGDSVTFDAHVDVSDDDPKFGFYKRPTKAQIN